MDAPSEAKQIRVAASTSSAKPCLWRQFSSVSVMQAAAICCSSMRSRKNVTCSSESPTVCFQMNTAVSTKSLLTVVDSSMRIDIFFSCFIRCLHTVAVSFLPQCALWLLHKRHLSEALAHANMLHSTPASQRAPACQQTGAAASQDNMQCAKMLCVLYSRDFCNRALICSITLFSAVANIRSAALCPHEFRCLNIFKTPADLTSNESCGFYWDIYRSRRQMNSVSLLGFDVPTLFYNHVFCCEQSTTDKSLSFQ